MDARQCLIATAASLSTVDRWVTDGWLPLDTTQLPGTDASAANYPINPPQAQPFCQLLVSDVHRCWWTQTRFQPLVCQPSTVGVWDKISLSTAGGCSAMAINFWILSLSNVQVCGDRLLDEHQPTPATFHTDHWHFNVVRISIIFKLLFNFWAWSSLINRAGQVWSHTGLHTWPPPLYNVQQWSACKHFYW